MSRDYELRPFRAPVDLQIDYAAELNPQQLAVVTAPPGPALVIAGAGAGKTRTLTYRVAYLLEQGIPADRILLLTFTNKAAREMMQRVADLLGGDVSMLWGGTFHSVGNRVLRQHAADLGYPRDFTILDREDAEDLIGACLGESDIDVKATRFPKADALAEVFSLAANKLKPIPAILEEQFPHFLSLAAEIEGLAARYQERKRTSGVMDFDDLLVLWLRLLKEHEEVRDLYQRRFQFILVDEYQDTNLLQAELIDLLAAKHHNVMAVGDDSQSIYSWRGANFANILRFPERHPNAVVHKIETNYRSTPEILNLANAAIAPNVLQFEKRLTPVRPTGPRPAVVVCVDASQQAGFVAQRILELREEGVALDQMAVLYRSHFHVMEIQMELARRNIPYTITSGIRFFEQAHVKDVTAYLRLLCNPRDELAFKRLARQLPGIGDKSADRLWAEFLGKLGDRPVDIAATLQGCIGRVPKKSHTAWSQFAITLSQLASLERKPAPMISLILEADYEDYLKNTYANYRSRMEDLEQLATFARQFESVEEFLAQLALLTNLEADTHKPSGNDEAMLKLTTIHQAKGLEFAVVFVIMLCEGLFPSFRSLESPGGEEEERRLFYVAVTRAKNELYLTRPLIRSMPGYQGDTMQQASRFLSDLPEDLREEWNLRVL
jgi:DNA helicase-2/ATP-dependent DNA helicase PcrA